MSEWDYGHIDIISDVTSIPRPNASFDVILCTEVLEHIPNPALVFPEFARLLKPGGQLILTAPFCSLTHFAPYHYSTGFSRYYYEYHLKENSFQVLEMSANGNYFDYLAQEIQRVPSIYSKYATNKLSKINIIIISQMLKLLRKLSFKSNKSEELLCFGYHVLAKKI